MPVSGSCFVGTDVHGSDISAGPGRLTNASVGRTLQVVAPGCYDLVDAVGWQPVSGHCANHMKHDHNRHLTSIVLEIDERLALARVPAHVTQHRIPCGINDATVADNAFEIFEAWRADGTIKH